MPVCGNYLFFELPKKIVLNPKDGNDLVEQDVPLIQKIMNVAPDFAPDYNVNDT